MLQLATRTFNRTFYIVDLIRLYRSSVGKVGSEEFVDNILDRAGTENSWSVPNTFTSLSVPRLKWGNCIDFSRSVAVNNDGEQLSVRMEVEDYSSHTANAITGVAFVVRAEDTINSLDVDPDTNTPRYMAEVPFSHEGKDYILVLLGNDY